MPVARRGDGRERKTVRFSAARGRHNAIWPCSALVIVRWETHLLPRTILPALHSKTMLTQLDAQFGYYGTFSSSNVPSYW